MLLLQPSASRQRHDVINRTSILEERHLCERLGTVGAAICSATSSGLNAPTATFQRCIRFRACLRSYVPAQCMAHANRRLAFLTASRRSVSDFLRSRSTIRARRMGALRCLLRSSWALKRSGFAAFHSRTRRRTHGMHSRCRAGRLESLRSRNSVPPHLGHG